MSLEDLFVGGGEMGRRMRELDWARSPLGPTSTWPQSLKTCVRIILTSRQPMFVWWGDELINLYNDAYCAILGGKHPHALGRPASEVWREIWDEIAPRAATAMRANEGTYDEALLLIMERHGYREETYYTFSYSPVPSDHGGTGGIICANTDDTGRIIGERQLGFLRDLAARTGEARTLADTLERAAEAFANGARDLPFAAIYLAEPGRELALARAVGISPAQLAAMIRTSAAFRDGLARRTPHLIDVPAEWSLPAGAWPEPPRAVALMPIAASGQRGHSGVLVVGLNPLRRFDDSYRGFLEVAAGQLAASIANAEAYEQERERAEALAEIDRAKTIFFSNVSHEFRTPLTLMLGPQEDALRSEARALTGDALAGVHRNTLRLLKLVNTLLDFSRIEAGRAHTSYEPVDLALATRELAATFRAAVERGGLRFDVDCDDLPEPIFVDRGMWEKIVLNLLSNAFKFTFAGAIRVELRAEPEQVRLRVSDTGVGIPAGERPRIFERFHRIEGTRSRTHEGTGIGLALVHDLVALHGGTIDVHSEVGAGTTFTVAIPRGRAHLPADRIGAAAADASASAGVTAAAFVAEAERWTPEPLAAELAPAPRVARPGRVLIADDNADMRDYLVRLLHDHGWAVRAVADGERALAAIRADPPDLVLTDVMMPNVGGFELLRRLRADPAIAAIPVIMLSARAGEESRAEGLEAGADDYLIKPFAARELIARVATHLQLARLRDEAVRASRAKDEFLAMLGHELRNPLAPILTALQLMRLRGGDAVVKERTVIERQARHLVHLVDDLLDISRITRGKIELRREAVELGEVVAKAIEMASPLIEQRRHELRLELAPQGLAVSADPARLAQVIANLLTNAAKYTEPGGTITISGGPAGNDAELIVRDTGIGIDAAMLADIFDLFVQERQALDRSQGGLGLGLSIVRSLVELHGGTVRAASEGRGRGSQFAIRLPRLAEAGVPASPPAELAEPPRRPAGPGRKVLIVDDNEDAADLLATYLEAMGNTTRIAHDGPEALRIAAEFAPDLALLDIGLPVMDGYELALRMREVCATRMRLIAVTGYGQESDKARAAAASFDLHLVKPVDVVRLERIIHDLGHDLDVT